MALMALSAKKVPDPWPKGFESESGFESEITRTRESFLKKLKRFESFESESEDSLLHYFMLRANVSL